MNYLHLFHRICFFFIAFLMAIPSRPIMSWNTTILTDFFHLSSALEMSDLPVAKVSIRMWQDYRQHLECNLWRHRQRKMASLSGKILACETKKSISYRVNKKKRYIHKIYHKQFKTIIVLVITKYSWWVIISEYSAF